LRKATFTRLRKVYVPTPFERFIGWLSVFAIGEGMIRFFITIWWAFVNYQNGRLGPVVFILEELYILFFAYRLLRMRVTMRVLNITRADIHGVIREFLTQAGLDPKWLEEKRLFVTANLGVRLRYFAKKSHAYLAFHAHHQAGREEARDLARHIRAQARDAGGPAPHPHDRALLSQRGAVLFSARLPRLLHALADGEDVLRRGKAAACRLRRMR